MVILLPKVCRTQAHRKNSEHRHICSYRFGQNHNNGAHTVLHRPHPGNARGEGERQYRGRDGFHGARKAERNHDSKCRHVHAMERPQYQHNRYPRSRRFHHGGRTCAASVGRRDFGVVCCRGRPVPVAHCEQADEAVQCAVPGFHKQIGQVRNQNLFVLK